MAIIHCGIMQKTIIETINRPDFISGKVYDNCASARPLLCRFRHDENIALRSQWCPVLNKG